MSAISQLPSAFYAPKVAGLHFNPVFGAGGNFMDAYIDFCWNRWSDGTEIILQNHVDIPQADLPALSSEENGKGSKWVVKGGIENEVLVFRFEALFERGGEVALPIPTAADGSELTFNIPKPSSFDTLRQGGIFDKASPKNQLNPQLDKVYLQQIDGDIKNQVSSALNRAVMHLEEDVR